MPAQRPQVLVLFCGPGEGFCSSGVSCFHMCDPPVPLAVDPSGGVSVCVLGEEQMFGSLFLFMTNERLNVFR